MTKEEVRESLADYMHLVGVMDAYLNGERVEFEDGNGAWLVMNNPSFGLPPRRYRVKPKTVLTQEQINAIKTIFPDVKYVAWDEGGSAFAYARKPGEYYEEFIPAGKMLPLPALDGAWEGDWKDSLTEI